MKKFKRGRNQGGRTNTNHKNERGAIVVRVFRRSDEGAGPQVGNITKSMTVRGATVSAVSKAITLALFGEKA